MASKFRPGDRIRLTSRVKDGSYRPGDRGVVLSGEQAEPLRWISYFVRMDGQPIGAWVRFTVEELEPDGERAEAPIACSSGQGEA